MANATVFLSSTCYDLSTVRSAIEDFLKPLHIGVLNSEKSNFGVAPGVHSHTACLERVKDADYLLLIIGSRRGGTYVASERSITNEEYNAAAKLGIPRIICINKAVLDTMPLWKKNPGMDISSVVKDERIFDFIDYIRAEATDNWIFPFETIDDIQKVLLGQFSHYLHLFSESQKASVKKEKTADVSKLACVDFPSHTDALGTGLSPDEQTLMRNGLRSLHAIMKNIITSDMKGDAKKESLKCLWVIARHGESYEGGMSIDNDIFKPYAWSTTRGRRVFKQLAQFGIDAHYSDDDYRDGIEIRLSFDADAEDDETDIAWALDYYIGRLIDKFGGDAQGFFMKADMRIFMTG